MCAVRGKSLFFYIGHYIGRLTENVNIHDISLTEPSQENKKDQTWSPKATALAVPLALLERTALIRQQGHFAPAHKGPAKVRLKQQESTVFNPTLSGWWKIPETGIG